MTMVTVVIHMMVSLAVCSAVFAVEITDASEPGKSTAERFASLLKEVKSRSAETFGGAVIDENWNREGVTFTTARLAHVFAAFFNNQDIHAHLELSETPHGESRALNLRTRQFSDPALLPCRQLYSPECQWLRMFSSRDAGSILMTDLMSFGSIRMGPLRLTVADDFSSYALEAEPKDWQFSATGKRTYIPEETFSQLCFSVPGSVRSTVSAIPSKAVTRGTISVSTQGDGHFAISLASPQLQLSSRINLHSLSYIVLGDLPAFLNCQFPYAVDYALSDPGIPPGLIRQIQVLGPSPFQIGTFSVHWHGEPSKIEVVNAHKSLVIRRLDTKM